MDTFKSIIDKLSEGLIFFDFSFFQNHEEYHSNHLGL